MIIRRATPDDTPGIARVHVDCWRKAYRGLLPQDFLNRLSYENVEKRDRGFFTRDGFFGFVALCSDEIVGFAFGGPESGGDAMYPGELYTLYVHQEHQGRGIGHALFLAIARELADRGISSMLLWVFAQNPACLFYERMGGRYLRRQPIQIEDTTLEEVAYGWEDIGKLTARMTGMKSR